MTYQHPCECAECDCTIIVQTEGETVCADCAAGSHEDEAEG